MSKKVSIHELHGKSKGAENSSRLLSRRVSVDGNHAQSEPRRAASANCKKRTIEEVHRSIAAKNDDDDEYSDHGDIMNELFDENEAYSSTPQSESTNFNRTVDTSSSNEGRQDIGTNEVPAAKTIGNTYSKAYSTPKRPVVNPYANPSSNRKDPPTTYPPRSSTVDGAARVDRPSTEIPSPRSLLSTVMQYSSSRSSTAAHAETLFTSTEVQNHYSIQNGRSHIRFEESFVNAVSNIDANDDSNSTENDDEDQDIILSLNQLTQEDFDFDEMFEPGDHLQSNTIEIEQDGQGMNPKMEVSKVSELKQPTLSQYYARDEYPSSQKPKIANFVEYNRRHYFRGDTWQLVAFPPSSKTNYKYSNLIVKPKSFTKEGIRGGKREDVAKVEPVFHLAIPNIPWLGEYGQIVVEHRMKNGRIGAGFVEFKHPSLSTDMISSVPRFQLKMFDHRITIEVTSDLMYGNDVPTTKDVNCFFEYKELPNSEKGRYSIPKSSEGKFTVLELYSGAGGFSLGLEHAGFHVTHHVDNDTAACSTLKENFRDSEVFQCTVKDFLTGCINTPTSKRYPQVGSIALIHGSTPCQGFSKANRDGGANDAANNAETQQFMDVVKHFQPPFVTFENVPGMTDRKNVPYLHKMMADFLIMDYQVRLGFVTASDYGDPQDRVRLIIFAAKEGFELPDLPKPTHGDDPSLLPKKKVGDAIGFLEDVLPLEYEGEVTALVDGAPMALQGHKIRWAEENKDDIKLVKDMPASTVIRHRVLRHYACNQRPLTRLEQSLLQSFPLGYNISGTEKEIRGQIGNAVPVFLAEAIAKSVMDAIHKSGV